MKTRRIVLFVFVFALWQVRSAHAQRLDDIVMHLADAWSHGDARAVVALSTKEGLLIETRDSRTGPLGSRQAAAVLRRLFEDRQTVSIKPGMTQMMSGSPRRAFAEITWITRAPDTTEMERLTVFIEFVLADERWQITQIRLLP